MALLRALINVVWYKLRKVKLVYILIGIIIAMSIYVSVLKSETNKTKIELNNRVVELTEVQRLFDDKIAAFERMAYQKKDIDEWVNKYMVLDSTSQIQITDTRNRLIKVIKDRDGKIQSLNTALLAIDKQTILGKADTIIIYETEDGIDYNVEFETEIGAIGIKGATWTNPPRYKVDAWLNPIAMEVYITKEGDNIYTSYVIFSDNNIKIPMLNTYVVPSTSPVDVGGFFKRQLNRINIFVGTEYLVDSKERNVYIRTQFKMWKFNPSIKFSNNDIHLMSEFKIW